MQFVIIADDLTGATDSGAQLCRAGYRVAVAFHDTPIPASDEFDAVVVDTDSRQLDPESARRRVSEAAQQLKDAQILYKKIDSTLRGPIAAEIEAAFNKSDRSRAIIAPAFPGNGRTTVGGVQMVYGRPVHETRFAEDPAIPIDEGHIPSLLSKAGLSDAGTLGIQDLEGVDGVRDALEKYQWVVADAAEYEHLESLVGAVPDVGEVLWVGSAGLVKALGMIYPGSRYEEPEGNAAPGGKVLTVVGSMNGVSRQQLRCLEKKEGIDAVAIPAAAAVAGRDSVVKNAVRAAGEYLRDGKSVALYSTGEMLAANNSTGSVVKALADVVAGLSEEDLFDALVLTGGDTAVNVSRNLGARGIMLKGEIEPGVALGTLIGPRPYPVITKAGGFGGPDTLLHALNTLAGKDEKF